MRTNRFGLRSDVHEQLRTWPRQSVSSDRGLIEATPKERRSMCSAPTLNSWMTPSRRWQCKKRALSKIASCSAPVVSIAASRWTSAVTFSSPAEAGPAKLRDDNLGCRGSHFQERQTFTTSPAPHAGSLPYHLLCHSIRSANKPRIRKTTRGLQAHHSWKLKPQRRSRRGGG
jgi:hypothetical protein